MEYDQLRKNILYYLNTLQDNGHSYQSICNFINSRQKDFVLYKDFFTRFQSKSNYFKSPGKREKLLLIHQQIQQFFQQNINEDHFLNNYLGKIVSDAAMVKFEALLETNRSYQPNKFRLAEFYLENSSAYLSIENNIKHKKQYGWELDILNYGSSYKVLSTKISTLFQKNAVVQTKEFWKLYWVQKKSRKLQFNFETIGQHIYLLSKDEGDNWKIIDELGTTPTNKIEPAFIDYPVLEKMASNHWEDNKAIAKKFLDEEDFLHCIAFIKTIYPNQLSMNQIAILDRIWESCLNSYRLLNTNVINYSVFKLELELLNKQLQLIVDGIFLSKK